MTDGNDGSGRRQRLQALKAENERLREAIENAISNLQGLAVEAGMGGPPPSPNVSTQLKVFMGSLKRALEQQVTPQDVDELPDPPAEQAPDSPSEQDKERKLRHYSNENIAAYLRGVARDGPVSENDADVLLEAARRLDETGAFRGDESDSAGS